MSVIEENIKEGVRPPIPQECKDNYPGIAELIEECWTNGMRFHFHNALCRLKHYQQILRKDQLS